MKNKKIIFTIIIIAIIAIIIGLVIMFNKPKSNYNDYVIDGPNDEIGPGNEEPESSEMETVMQFATDNGIGGSVEYITDPNWNPDLWRVFSSGYKGCYCFCENDVTTVIVIEDGAPTIFETLGE